MRAAAMIVSSFFLFRFGFGLDFTLHFVFRQKHVPRGEFTRIAVKVKEDVDDDDANKGPNKPGQG